MAKWEPNLEQDVELAQTNVMVRCPQTFRHIVRYIFDPFQICTSKYTAHITHRASFHLKWLLH